MVGNGILWESHGRDIARHVYVQSQAYKLPCTFVLPCTGRIYKTLLYM